MKPRTVAYWIGLILILFSLQITGYLVPLISRLASSPWWILLVLAGVIFCGYQFFSISREEEEIDQAFIEQEGKVYMERMEEEKERRRSKSNNKKDAV